MTLFGLSPTGIKFTRIISLCIVAVVLLLVTACGEGATATPGPTSTPAPVVITDSNGKQVIFTRPPERIVAFDSEAVEILFAMGEGHRVVGTHSFVDYPPEAADIPRVGDAFNMDFEQIVALEPDLVYIFFDRFLPELEDLGLKVLYIKSLNSNLEDVMTNFRNWGRVTDNPQAAEAEVEKMQARLATLDEKLDGVDKGLRVYHHTFDFWTPGGDTLFARIYERLNAELVTSEISGFAQISPEEVVVKDPQVIVTPASAADQVTDNPALRETTAVKNGRVVIPRPGSLSVAGTRLVEDMEELAELLYPELFP